MPKLSNKIKEKALIILPLLISLASLKCLSCIATAAMPIKKLGLYAKSFMLYALALLLAIFITLAAFFFTLLTRPISFYKELINKVKEELCTLINLVNI